MKIAPVVVLAALGIFGYPLLNEQTASSCHALEKRVVSLVANNASQDDKDPLSGYLVSAFADSFLDGSLASALAKQKYPSLPPFIGCTAVYWDSFFDPQLTQAMQNMTKG